MIYRKTGNCTSRAAYCMAKKTVKVRGRKGTATMDISIPAQITREHEVERGDVFTIDTGRMMKGVWVSSTSECTVAND